MGELPFIWFVVGSNAEGLSLFTVFICTLCTFFDIMICSACNGHIFFVKIRIEKTLLLSSSILFDIIMCSACYPVHYSFEAIISTRSLALTFMSGSYIRRCCCRRKFVTRERKALFRHCEWMWAKHFRIWNCHGVCLFGCCFTFF